MLLRSRWAAPSGFIEPCLPSPADRPPSGPGWVHEIKHDGFRLMARRDAAGVRLLTRNGIDWTERYPQISEAAGALKVRSFLIDGEAVACDRDGMPVFDRLRYRRADGAVFMFAFDLIELNGQDLRREPLEVRKRELGKLLRWAAQIGLQFNEHIAEPGDVVFRHACKLGFEGIVSKCLGSCYISGHTRMARGCLALNGTMSRRFMQCVLAALCCLPAVSIAANDDSKELERVLAKVRSEPMIFIVATGEPNACGRGCTEWIAGQGQFDEGAAQRFREFLAILAKRDLPIFFNSDGGLLSQAVQIGLILRENRMTAGVARTVPEGCHLGFPLDGACRQLMQSKREHKARLYFGGARCGSACVYAMVGASTRHVDPGATLRIHSGLGPKSTRPKTSCDATWWGWASTRPWLTLPRRFPLAASGG